MDWKQLGKNLQIAREVRGMTQPDLAEKLSCHRATIARIEGGGQTRPARVLGMAKAIGMDLEQIAPGASAFLGVSPSWGQTQK